MGTVNGVNGGTILSFTPTPSLHAVTSRMPSHHQNGCANFTFQLPSIANASKKNTNSAERRANHNAVERARRECLNTKFQELAHALPSLAQVRRPSKSIIVQKSLEFIYKSRQRDDMHDEEMRIIRSENDSLHEEINILREKLGLEPLPPRKESKSITPQQTDDSKDTKININTPEIKTEPNNNNNHNTPSSTDAHDPISSNDIQLKTEDSRSDDDCSNGNTDDDYDIESSECIENNNVEINQTTKQTNQHTENQACFYDNLIYHQPLLDPNLDNHTGYTNFSFTMDMSPIDHLVDANSLHLQFDHDPLNGNDMNPFCDSFQIQQKYYPSPPFEATQMLDISSHIPGGFM
ncbi:hypothetical protein Glove_415g33 [Diversispora epigaea]|uniref:BHLH domain-containing protein n=1 Tax=Diversispora epigaea TaxID=1348612 RepID=A0A397H0N9_9GLOM|nr:hypothetical protein Glove_415g33 [Diversispora epigaea]